MSIYQPPRAIASPSETPGVNVTVAIPAVAESTATAVPLVELKLI